MLALSGAATSDSLPASDRKVLPPATRAVESPQGDYRLELKNPDEKTALAVLIATREANREAAYARQQAMRGTVDPMFLGYTLGKLLIMELRADWQRANPTKSLRDFHDELLRYGEAPLPVTRRMMLGDGAKPPLHD